MTRVTVASLGFLEELEEGRAATLAWLIADGWWVLGSCRRSSDGPAASHPLPCKSSVPPAVLSARSVPGEAGPSLTAFGSAPAISGGWVPWDTPPVRKGTGLVLVGGCRAQTPSPSPLLSEVVHDALGDASSWDSPWHKSVPEPPFHCPLQPV